MNFILSIFIFLGLSFAKAAPFSPYTKKIGGQDITFLTAPGVTAEEFSQMSYTTKPDQAFLQNEYPLSRLQRQALKPEDFQKMTQEEIDQIYVRLSSGSIQPGKYHGSVLQKIELVQRAKKLMLSKYKGIDRFGSLLCGKQDYVECLAELAWKGKRIYEPTPDTGEFMLRNAISKTVGLAVKTALLPLKDNLNFHNWMTNTTDDFYGESKFMLFPARVYCGQSLFDHRRESVVIDYAWGSDFTPFIKGIDELAGREFLAIRDEIRMVRPGLYLGRAYSNKIFLLNFVLYNPEAESKFQLNGSWPQDACFNGKTTR